MSDVRLRSLACIKTSLVNECTYCTAHTRIYGEALGLTGQEFKELQGDYGASTVFNEREKAVIAWAEAMTLNTAKRDQKLWEDMRRLFSYTEIVEISMALGLFNMANRFNDSFWSELEPEEYPGSSAASARIGTPQKTRHHERPGASLPERGEAGPSRSSAP